MQYEELRSVLSIHEIIFLTHTNDDIDYLRIFEKEVSTVTRAVNDLTQMINDVIPDTQLDHGEMKKKIDSLLDTKLQNNPYAQYNSTLKQLLKEVSDVLDFLEAGQLAQSKIDLYRISKLLGHKDISTTQRYAHHCPDSLRDGVEILETDYNLTTVEKKGGY